MNPKPYQWMWIITLALYAPQGVADWQVTSESIVQVFERDTSDSADDLVVPVHEYLSVDYGDMAEGGFSFQGYGWVRKDAGGSDFYEKDPEGELIYAYIAYEKPYDPFRVYLGRQHVFGGTANDAMDGVWVETAAGPHTTISLYGGVPVAGEDTDGRHKDLIYGGRVAVFLNAAAEMGLAYKKRDDAGHTREQTAAMDFYWTPVPSIQIEGQSAFNIKTRGFETHQYDARFLIGDFEFSPMFHYFAYQDYFSSAESSANLFQYLVESGETLTLWGGDLGWHANSMVDIFLKARHFAYEENQSGANLVSCEVASDISDNLTMGASAGKMSGSTNENRYTLLRTFFIWTAPALLGPAWHITTDGMYQKFDAPVYGKDTALFGALGVSRKSLNNTYHVQATVNYASDPYFDHDLSLLATILIQY